jgi:soluble lytic murein transglycosylase-like protein
MNRATRGMARTLRVFAPLLCAALAASPLCASEVAHLRNGFTIAHCSREAHGASVRLYLDEARTNFIDVPAAQIASYSVQPDEPRPAPTAEATASQPNSQSTEQLAREAGERQGVDADFVGSVIRQESNGNPQAVSPAGARGLMQLMPQTASDLGVQDSFDPKENVRGGTQYLRQLLERYHGDAVKALAAYNAGPAAVDRYHGVPPYPETRRYVRRVVRDYNRKKSAPSSAVKKKAATGKNQAPRANASLATP